MQIRELNKNNNSIAGTLYNNVYQQTDRLHTVMESGSRNTTNLKIQKMNSKIIRRNYVIVKYNIIGWYYNFLCAIN